MGIRTIPSRLGLFVIAIAIIAGCSRSPRVTLYTLTPLAEEITSTAQIKAVPLVSIAPITLPELLDRPQIVINQSDSQVQLMESHRWAEPLKTALPRTLAENMTRLLGNKQKNGLVTAWPQHAAAKADYRLLLDLQRMEQVGNNLYFDVTWQLLESSSGKLLVIQQSRIREALQTDGVQGLVEAHDRALEQLAREIVIAILDQRSVQDSREIGDEEIQTGR